MFKSVELTELDSSWNRIRANRVDMLAWHDNEKWVKWVNAFCDSTPGEQVAPGVWTTWTHNFDHDYLSEEFDSFPERALANDAGMDLFDWAIANRCPCSYGVCDSAEQFLASDVFASYNARPEEFIASLTEVKRSEQPPNGGWRWHKWGQYIGTHDIQCEYLADEKGIESVFCFQIYLRRSAGAQP